MNTFVIQMQSALKQRLHTVANNVTNNIANNITNNIATKFAIKSGGTSGRSNNGSTASRLPGINPRLHPNLIARALQYLGMAIAAMAVTYWALQWWQPPPFQR